MNLTEVRTLTTLLERAGRAHAGWSGDSEATDEVRTFVERLPMTDRIAVRIAWLRRMYPHDGAVPELCGEMFHALGRLDDWRSVVHLIGTWSPETVELNYIDRLLDAADAAERGEDTSLRCVSVDLDRGDSIAALRILQKAAPTLLARPSTAGPDDLLGDDDRSLIEVLSAWRSGIETGGEPFRSASARMPPPDQLADRMVWFVTMAVDLVALSLTPGSAADEYGHVLQAAVANAVDSVHGHDGEEAWLSLAHAMVLPLGDLIVDGDIIPSPADPAEAAAAADEVLLLTERRPRTAQSGWANDTLEVVSSAFPLTAAQKARWVVVQERARRADAGDPIRRVRVRARPAAMQRAIDVLSEQVQDGDPDAGAARVVNALRIAMTGLRRRET